MLQLNHVRCFVAVAQELHFGRAAERLHMTQPPLSRSIQQLEWSLGVVLLERKQNNVQLTAAGRAFLPEAQHLLDVADSAESAVRRSVSRTAAVAVLGYVPGAGFEFLPRVMVAARRLLPDLDIVLREMTTRDALASLRSRRIQLAIVRAPAECHGLGTACVVREPLLAAIPGGHPLAALKRLRMQDLDGVPFVMYRPGQGGYYYELLSYAFHAANVAPRYVQYIQQTHNVLAMVGGGLGIALLPRSTAVARHENVVYRPIDLPPHAVSELHLAWLGSDEAKATHLEQLRQLIIDNADISMSAVAEGQAS